MEKKIIYETLDLQVDIYSYTFFQFAKSDNTTKISELMGMCFAAFTIQVGILISKYSETMENETPVFVGDIKINMARIVAAYIMHLMFYPEIKVAMQMIHYAVYNRENMIQRNAFFPIFIAGAKFVGATATEFATIYFMVRDKTVTSVIMSYLTFTIVSRIDDIMGQTLTNVDIEAEIAADPIKFNACHRIYDDIRTVKRWKNQGDMNILQWVFMVSTLIISRVLRFIYVTVYFYFVPFIVVAIAEFTEYRANRLVSPGAPGS